MSFIKTNKANLSIRPDQTPKEYQRTAAHLVRPSPWPILTAFSVGSLLISTASYFHACEYGQKAFMLALVLLLLSMYIWFTDIVTEATFEGQHTQLVQNALRYGMYLFIVSEIMFFFSFFWSFFDYSLSPSINIFCVWTPKGIIVIDPWGVPFLNTTILLSSGVTLTLAHRAIIANKMNVAWYALLWTIVYGVIFTLWQAYEYIHCQFNINDSVYGSIFFVATGFHGLHVIVGTILLIVSWLRLKRGHFTAQRHLGFECAAYYWHFVDVVWLFLFTTIYWWGC